LELHRLDRVLVIPNIGHNKVALHLKLSKMVR